MLSVVIPAYNEAENISVTAIRIDTVLSFATIDYELIFVDDGSTDETFATITTLSNDKQVRGLKFSRNFGKEAAIMAGLNCAKGDCCAVLDCDLQHPPEKLVEMYRLWQEGAMIVEGIKVDRGKEALWYRLLAKLFYGIMNCFAGFDLQRSSDYKLLDRKVVDILCHLPEKKLFFRGLSSYFGFAKAEVFFEVAPRYAGKSKWNLLGLWRYAINNITAFSALPLQIVTCTGVFMFIIFVVLGIQTLYNYITGQSIEGFTTVILLLLFIGSTLAIGLGVIGHYIARIYDEVKGRPVYIVEQEV